MSRELKKVVTGKYSGNEEIIPYVTNATVTSLPSGNVIVRFYNEIRKDYVSYSITLDDNGKAIKEENSLDDSEEYLRLLQASVEMSKDTLLSIRDLLNNIVAEIDEETKWH